MIEINAFGAFGIGEVSLLDKSEHMTIGTGDENRHVEDDSEQTGLLMRVITMMLKLSPQREIETAANKAKPNRKLAFSHQRLICKR